MTRRRVATVGDIPDALRRSYGHHESDDGFGWDWEADPLAEQAAEAIEMLLAVLASREGK